MKTLDYIGRSTAKVCLVLLCYIVVIISVQGAKADAAPSTSHLTQSEIALIQSLSPQKISMRNGVVFSSKQLTNQSEQVIDRGNRAKILAALKRTDLSIEARNIILAIPTQTKIGASRSAFIQKRTVSSVPSCQYADTAHGYVQNTNSVGIVTWSYDVLQPFNVGNPNAYGPTVCSFGARNPTFFANGLLTWKNGGETWSRADAPDNEITEINKAFFNPGYGFLPGDVARISLFMYGGGYWDVSVGLN
jgi:hypothetical protein